MKSERETGKADARDARSLSILGCGYLGKAVALKFINEGWRVNGSTTHPDKLEALAALHINPFVVSIAGGPAAKYPEQFFDTDVLLIAIPPKGGDERYVQEIAALGQYIASTRVARVIFISSTGVYSNLEREVREEDADTASNLFRAEQCVRQQAGYRTTVLRFGGLVGEGRHPGKFLSGKTNVAGGDSPVNIIHLRDCTEIIYTIAVMNIFGEVFNACADLHPARREFYSKASAALELPPPVFNDQAAPYKQVNSEKLKRHLGYDFYFPDPMLMF
jgi:nucleoside-diphosphate-sugar epimerase